MYTSPSNPFVAMSPLAQQLHQNLRQQIEFYFSDDNLRKDNFLQALLTSRDHPGLVPVATIASFPRVREIYASAMAGQHIPAAHAGPADPVVVGMSVKESNRVQVSDDGHWLRPIMMIHNASYNNAYTDPPLYAAGGTLVQNKGTSPASVSGGTKATTASSTPSVSPTSFDSGEASQMTRERTVVWVQSVMNVEESEVLDAFTTDTFQPLQVRLDAGHCWHVVFASEEQAISALEASRTKQIGGRFIHAMLQTPQHLYESTSMCGMAPQPPAQFVTMNPTVPAAVSTTLGINTHNNNRNTQQEHAPQMVLAAYPPIAYPHIMYGISHGQHPVTAHQQGYVVGVPYAFHHSHQPYHPTGFVAASAPMEHYQWQQQPLVTQPPPLVSFEPESSDVDQNEVAAVAVHNITAGTMQYTTHLAATAETAPETAEPALGVYYSWNSNNDNQKFQFRKPHSSSKRNQHYRGGEDKGACNDDNLNKSSCNNDNSNFDEQVSSGMSSHSRSNGTPQRKKPPVSRAVPPPLAQPELPMNAIQQEGTPALNHSRGKRTFNKKWDKKKRREFDAATSATSPVATAASAANTVAKDEDGNGITSNLSEEHFPALEGRSEGGKSKQKTEQPPSLPYAAALMKKAPKDNNKGRGSNRASKKQMPAKNETAVANQSKSGDGENQLSEKMADLSVID